MASLQAFGEQELERFTRTFEELFDAADPEAMTSYYTEQAQLMADGITPLRGHGPIELFWRTAIGRAKAAGARRAIHLHEAHCSGDLGYALCTVTVEIPPGARRASWDATVWQRDPAGHWRIAVDISTPLPTWPQPSSAIRRLLSCPLGTTTASCSVAGKRPRALMTC